VHPWALLFSLFKVEVFRLPSALGSFYRLLLPKSLPEESVLPKDGEPDSQDDIVYPSLSSWGGHC